MTKTINKDNVTSFSTEIVANKISQLPGYEQNQHVSEPVTKYKGLSSNFHDRTSTILLI